MIGKKEIESITKILTDDDVFCRLCYYGEEPLSEDKENIVGSANHNSIMENIIRNSPQLDDIENREQSRVCLYKGQTKLRFETSQLRAEFVKVVLYVPHRIMRIDNRVYDLENKISSLLDGFPMGIGCMDYVEGSFQELPNLVGYTQYNMVFAVDETRRFNRVKL